MSEDIPIFQSLLNDIFPETRVIPTQHTGLREAIQASAEKLGLMWTEPSTDKQS